MSISMLGQAWENRAGLARALSNREYVESLDPAKLKEAGVGAIVLDHDGVLGPNLSEGPDGAGVEFIGKCLEVFGPGSVFILSNTTTMKETRNQVYGENHPGVTYLLAKRKPDSDGLQQVSRQTGLPLFKIAIVDDGLMTGIVMAVESGAIPVYAVRSKIQESFKAWLIRMITTIPQLIIVWLATLFPG